MNDQYRDAFTVSFWSIMEPTNSSRKGLLVSARGLSLVICQQIRPITARLDTWKVPRIGLLECMEKRDQQGEEQQPCLRVIRIHQSSHPLIERVKWKEHVDHRDRTWPGILNRSNGD